ncbi:MAG: glycosyltransferase family 4 protein [Candidatus Obscuribacterales bacterium]|jgi:glycosyltransferase involved in cell wall biosynthesis|nr:glycosyltransferase family 4 protein [Candidatus Obscuribacterales bacterium]
MRICLISREYPPETGFGGIATFVRHLAHGLKELGNEVEVVALAKETEKVVDDDGVKVHRVLPYKLEGDLDAVNRCMPYSRYVLLTTLGLWRKFHELHRANPFDVAESPELLAESIYASVTRVVPLVVRLYTPHSKFIAENLHNTAATFDHLFVAMLERVAMAGADVLTCPSQDLAEFVAGDLPCPIESISIVRNPIDPDEFSPEGPLTIAKDDKIKVLFVGRLEERKGIQFLVDAIPSVLKECPNTQFIIIGDDTINASGGQRSQLADLKDTLRAAGCEGNVTFIPRIPLSELPAYYRSADISVVPSLYDNSPYTCLEAMSCGRAVIGTSAGGTREYIEDGESGVIVPPRDSQAIAGAIIKLIKEPEYRQYLSKNARQRVMDKFQRKKIAQETMKLYETAIQRHQVNQHSLYRRPSEQAVPDAAVMLYCMDRMIYNLMYQESYRFRLSYWLHHMMHRPRLFFAKLSLALCKALSKPFNRRPDQAPALVRWLENQVRSKQDNPLQKVIDEANRLNVGTANMHGNSAQAERELTRR